MTRHPLLHWLVEFVSVTAIAVILAIDVASNWLILIPAVVLVAGKAYQYRAFVAAKHQRVQVQLRLLLRLLPVRGRGVRCTYHVPVKRLLGPPRWLQQAFNYLPDGGGAGRRFPIDKGIIGLTYQEKSANVENFTSDEEYREQMVARYHYTPHELASRTADRKSYLCYPILDDTSHIVLGLLYFDSGRTGTFAIDEGDTKWKMIETAATVIRSHLM